MGKSCYSAPPGDNVQIYHLRVGTIRQRAQLPPEVQNWCRSALGWTMDLKRVQQNR